MLTTMRFPEDLVELPSVKTGKLGDKELALAGRLIDGMAGEWDPGRYHDD